jgi:hypothetical protein
MDYQEESKSPRTKSTLTILSDLNCRRHLDTVGNGSIVGELKQDIEQRLGERLKANLGKIVTEAFGFAGNPELLDERDFLDGAVSSIMCDSKEDRTMVDWAKQTGDKHHTNPTTYLFALAIYAKGIAKQTGMLKQRGLRVYRPQTAVAA